MMDLFCHALTYFRLSFWTYSFTFVRKVIKICMI
uniref:Uncharacterized protein n=1 Tax=Anguilla anguilla TaxID=7936 RepID=A0A0E9RWY0_ANGAN